jgi:hypothetical protein
MSEPSRPASYSIEKLLSQTVQPFPDLPPEEFEQLKESIRTKGLIKPVGLTEDGYLYDGHQRCKALIALGRKRISAEQVEIKQGVTRENMLGYALASNTVRRMLTTKDKAERMHALAAIGWSQRRIANQFGMSQPAVSQLMSDYPADDNLRQVTFTKGEDGKLYPRPPKAPKPPKPMPWAHGGESFKAITKARNAIRMGYPSGLDEWQKEALTQELEVLREGIDEFLAHMEGM